MLRHMPRSSGAFFALTAVGGAGLAGLAPGAERYLAHLSTAQIEAAGGAAAIRAALLVQPLLWVMLASAIGLGVAEKIGVRSLIADHFRFGPGQQNPCWRAAACFGAMAGGLLIVGDTVFAQIYPAAFAALRSAAPSPAEGLLLGVSYGGMTEEVIMRWGLLSLLAWVMFRIGLSLRIALGSAIILAAIFFAFGHLPALFMTVDAGPVLVGRTLLLNAGAGLIFGYMFVRHNLETAMLTHAAAHLVLFLARISGL